MLWSRGSKPPCRPPTRSQRAFSSCPSRRSPRLATLQARSSTSFEPTVERRRSPLVALPSRYAKRLDAYRPASGGVKNRLITSTEGTMMKLQRISALLAALMMALPLVSMADDHHDHDRAEHVDRGDR